MLIFREKYWLIIMVAVIMQAHYLHGQYALGEYGIRAGLGLAPSLSQANVFPVVCYSSHFFYSYYFCGKNYGYEVEGGIHGADFKSAKASPNWSGRANEALAYHLRLLYGDIGVLAKLRKNNYHRHQEWALLAGLKLKTRLLSSVYNTKPLGYETNLATANFVESNFFIPSLQSRVRYRHSFSRSRTLYLEPTFEWLLLPSAQTRDLKLHLLFIYFQASYAFGSAG
jgi:hypothetical protein